MILLWLPFGNKIYGRGKGSSELWTARPPKWLSFSGDMIQFSDCANVKMTVNLTLGMADYGRSTKSIYPGARSLAV